MPRIAIVGATGLVGDLIRRVLEERRFPCDDIRFLASGRSAGQDLSFRGKSHVVEPLSPQSFAGIDFVLSSTPAGVSREFSPLAARAGAIVIDNSSAWRMDPDVPLVVPEVNLGALNRIPKGIVANPNCSTIQLVVALKPLHDRARIRRIVVSTYQASSGKGGKGLADLDAQQAALGRGQPVPPPSAHAGPLAGNVLAHDWKRGDDGFTEEETKMVRETCKIMGDESIRVVPTCVRVPVRVGHSESVSIECERPISPAEAESVLRSAPGVILADAPTPLEIAGRDEVFVGRIRKDPTVPHGLCLWIVADNLRKGAATNAVQIAEALFSRDAKSSERSANPALN